MRIGFIGLGIMGRPMVKNLLKAAHDVCVYDINEEVVKELVNLGAAEGISSTDVASKSEVVITMLPNSPHVKSAVLGKDGVIQGAKEGTVVIDMSSIAPMASKEIHDALLEKGIEMLDAPVSGGEPKAINGTIAVMVGGKRGVFDRMYKLMMTMAESVVYVGDIGAGNTAKLCNQAIVAINIAAVSEAMMLAKKAGANPELVYQAIRGGLAGSTVMDAKVPMILEGNFEPGFRIDLHIKDLNNVFETSKKIDAPLPLTKKIMEMMQVVKEDGYGDSDHSSIVKFYEKLGSLEVRR